MILAHDNENSQLHINRQMHDRQRALGDIMRKNGYTLKRVSLQSGIPYNTLRGYFPSDQADLFPNIMPITALVQLFGVLPDDWLSVLTEPEGRVFGKPSEDSEATIREMEEAKNLITRALAKVKGGAL